MAKKVFQPEEIVDLTAQRIKVAVPEIQQVEPEPIDVDVGPTADDLRREAENFRQVWEAEKEQMIQEAQDEAESIRKEAERSAFEEAKTITNEAIEDKQRLEEESERIRNEALAEAEKLRSQAADEKDGVFDESRKAGYEEGREGGWKEGMAEAERLVGRLHTILDATIAKRRDIINETETQLIDLVLLIARKVVKVISANQKNVVINNIVQALKKLKSRGDVVIRVNLADLDLSTEHVKDFLKMVEDVKSITVLEDSSVDRGGAVIETDFGQIDARIFSQLKEIEEKILALVPIRSNGEG